MDFLIENNAKQIDQIAEFLQSKTPLLLVNGFMGTGKNTVVNHALASAAIVLKYNCFETTVLDDVLLSFFDDFKKLIALNIITPPKIKSENFVQKINSYFESIEKPVIVLFDSFEEILRENKQEILDFIFHLASYPNVKIILISRVFALDDFEKINYEKVLIPALEKKLFEKYLRSNNIKQIGPLSDELYKYTRGYYFYTTLSIKIMKLKNLSLTDFLSGYTKSMLTFNDFILREALALVDPVSMHLFRFLTMIRHPVSIKLLKTLNLYDDTKAEYFIENLVLNKQDSSVYLQDYYKNISRNSIPENIAVKLHRGCVELYETQLPLKPLERDLLISRQTMRAEIEYHQMFIPKKPVIKPVSLPQVPQLPAPEKQEKDEQLKNMSFIFESEEVLNSIAGSIEHYIEEVEEQGEIRQMTLTELINLAKQEEQNYNYKKVIAIYQKALEHTDDDDYTKFLPTLLTKIASAFKSASDWFNALKYYERAQKLFEVSGDIEKINEMKWETANIYYITFKKDRAKELFEEILHSGQISNSLRIKTYLSLASCHSEPQVKNLFEHALAFVDNTVDKDLLSELYFKYGLLLDESNETERSVQFYKKCIELNSGPYLSSAFSNIAAIFEDIGKYELAVKYSLESLRIDEQAKNYNGIYISAMKLAEIYTDKDPERAVEYYKKAKACAKELNEPFYIASAATALGDFYLNRKDGQTALKYYEEALADKDHFSKDNIQKIEMRILDAKRISQ